VGEIVGNAGVTECRTS